MADVGFCLGPNKGRPERLRRIMSFFREGSASPSPRQLEGMGLGNCPSGVGRVAEPPFAFYILQMASIEN